MINEADPYSPYSYTFRRFTPPATTEDNTIAPDQLQHTTISVTPPLSLGWRPTRLSADAGCELANDARIERISFNLGSVAVVHGVEGATPKHLIVALLAGCGMINDQIGELLYISPSSVKTHLSIAFGKYQAKNRTHVNRKFLESGIYDIINPAKPLTLSPREHQVADLLSHGLTNEQVGIEQGIVTNTVKSQIENIKARNGLSNREQIAFAALLSRQISFERTGQTT